MRERRLNSNNPILITYSSGDVDKTELIPFWVPTINRIEVGSIFSETGFTIIGSSYSYSEPPNLLNFFLRSD
jgi:hypothetical protein